MPSSNSNLYRVQSCYISLILGIIAALMSGTPLANGSDDSLTNQDLENIYQKIQPSLVQVEFYLRYHNSEAPYSTGRRIPGEQHIDEERPAETGGYLVSPTLVVASDPLIHERFIEKILVHQGSQVIEAEVAAFLTHQTALVLKLNEPLTGAEPLQFDPTLEEPYVYVHYNENNGIWATKIWPKSNRITAIENRVHTSPITEGSIIVNQTGSPIGIWMGSDLPIDESWKGSPLDQPQVSSQQVTELNDVLQDAADSTVLRVALSFRSPKRGSTTQPWMMEGEDTERDVAGLLIDSQRILVLTGLKPNVTARLERIRVYAPGEQVRMASFVSSLRNYEAFIVELDEPLPSPTPLSDLEILTFQYDLLGSAEVRVRGENRTLYVGPTRLVGFRSGWKGRIYPSMGHFPPDTFLFDQEGELIALPIARRRKVAIASQWDESMPEITAANDIRFVLHDLAEHIDPDNVPLPEEQENRIAWLGVELQAMDQELARVNQLADQTNDGTTGAIVTYVYPGSPAAQADLSVGDILLRLHAEDQPKPIEIMVEDDFWANYGGFPWDQLDGVPVEAFDQVPPPWPGLESEFNRRLMSLGFGTPFTVDVFSRGELRHIPFTVTESPMHYSAAPRYESEDLGITIRDLTYEVRYYFRMTDDESGVIISRVEPGGKAAVAGLKPFERIVHVNEQPVTSVEEFKFLIKGQRELRLEAKRKTRGRVIKLQQDVPQESETEETSDG